MLISLLVRGARATTVAFTFRFLALATKAPLFAAAIARRLLASLAVSVTTAAISLLARARSADVDRFADPAIVLDADGHHRVGSLNGRKVGHSLGMSGELELQLVVVVDLDAGGAVHWMPAQLESSAIALHDTGENLALASHAGSAAVGDMRLATASADSGHSNADCLLSDVGDADFIVTAWDSHDAIVVLRAALA